MNNNEQNENLISTDNNIIYIIINFIYIGIIIKIIINIISIIIIYNLTIIPIIS